MKQESSSSNSNVNHTISNSSSLVNIQLWCQQIMIAICINPVSKYYPHAGGYAPTTYYYTINGTSASTTWWVLWCRACYLILHSSCAISNFTWPGTVQILYTYYTTHTTDPPPPPLLQVQVRQSTDLHMQIISHIHLLQGRHNLQIQIRCSSGKRWQLFCCGYCAQQLCHHNSGE